MNKQLKWGIILQYLQMGLNMLIKIIYTPIMLRILGQSEYGLYNLASSIISYLSILSLGFGAGYIRFYSKYKAEEDNEKIKKLNGMYLTLFSIIALISLVAGTFLSFNVKWFFNDSYTSQDLHIAKILMLFLTFNLAISFLSSIFVSYTTSQEKFIFQKVLNLATTVFSPMVTIVVLLLGYGSIGMVIVSTIISIVTNLINVIFCIKKLGMRFSFGKFDKSVFKDIAVFSFFIAINQLIDQINWQTDKIILGKMISASAVAIYAVASTINNIYMQFSTAVSSVFSPKIHGIISNTEKSEERKNRELNSLFIRVGRIQYMILMLIVTGFIFFGKYFISKWAGQDYEIAYYIVLILMVPSTIPLIKNCGIEIQRAKNKHQFRSLVYLFIAVTNVIISIILCKSMGIIGVTVGTFISSILGTGLIINIYYHKKIGLNIPLFWKEILKISLGMIIPIAFGIVLMLFVNIKSILVFILLVVAYTVVYLVSLYFLSMKQYERKFVNEVFIKVSKKTKLLKRHKKTQQENEAVVVTQSHLEEYVEDQNVIDMVDYNISVSKEFTDDELPEKMKDKPEDLAQNVEKKNEKIET